MTELFRNPGIPFEHEYVENTEVEVAFEDEAGSIMLETAEPRMVSVLEGEKRRHYEELILFDGVVLQQAHRHESKDVTAFTSGLEPSVHLGGKATLQTIALNEAMKFMKIAGPELDSSERTQIESAILNDEEARLEAILQTQHEYLFDAATPDIWVRFEALRDRYSHLAGKIMVARLVRFVESDARGSLLPLIVSADERVTLVPKQLSISNTWAYVESDMPDDDNE